MIRDKLNKPLRLEGKKVLLVEISPKYFPYVIEWRNNPELNKFLNQPFKLTMENQTKWYEEKYLRDDTQLLLILVDKVKNVPFATTGYTNIDLQNRKCIKGRLILGNKNYARHPAFTEGLFLAQDYIFNFVDIQYAHIVTENHGSFQNAKWFGFELNKGDIQYPEELLVNGMEQKEIFCTKEMHLNARKKFFI